MQDIGETRGSQKEFKYSQSVYSKGSGILKRTQRCSPSRLSKQDIAETSGPQQKLRHTQSTKSMQLIAETAEYQNSSKIFQVNPIYIQA